MIVYFDTSALVPLMIEEPTSTACGELWDSADAVACTRLGYIEAVAAVAMAERLRRISAVDALNGRAILDELWSAMEVIELGHQLMDHAAQLAVRHGLRGYDATHCAAAVEAHDDQLVAASGDKRLLDAWRREHLQVRDIEARTARGDYRR